MEQDYYYQEIENNTQQNPQIDYYSEEVDKKIPAYEKVLRGAAEHAAQVFMPSTLPGGFTGTPPITNPSVVDPNSFINAIRGTAGAGVNRALGTNEIQNPLLRGMAEMPANIATDPLTVMGAKNVIGSGIKNGLGNAGGFLKSVWNAPKSLQGVKRELGTIESELSNIGNTDKSLTTMGLTDLPESIAQNTAGTKKGLSILNKVEKSITPKTTPSDKLAYKSEKGSLQEKLYQASSKDTEHAKKALAQTKSENSSIYEHAMEELDPKDITPAELWENVHKPALKEIKSKNLPSGPTEYSIRSFESRLPKVEEEVPQQLDWFGNEMKTQSKPVEPQKPLSLKDIQNHKNDIYNSTSSSYQSGQGVEPTDIAHKIWKDKLDQFLDKRVNGYKELREEAAPILESQNYAERILQPSSKNVNKGQNIFEKMATKSKGKLLDERRKFGTLESGTQGEYNFKGTGPLGNESKKVAEELKQLDIKYQGNKQAAIQDIDNRISDIQKFFNEAKSNVSRAGQETNVNLLKKQGELGSRKSVLENQKKELQKLVWTKRALLGVGIEQVAEQIPGVGGVVKRVRRTLPLVGL